MDPTAPVKMLWARQRQMQQMQSEAERTAVELVSASTRAYLEAGSASGRQVPVDDGTHRRRSVAPAAHGIGLHTNQSNKRLRSRSILMSQVEQDSVQKYADVSCETLAGLRYQRNDAAQMLLQQQPTKFASTDAWVSAQALAAELGKLSEEVMEKSFRSVYLTHHSPYGPIEAFGGRGSFITRDPGSTAWFFHVWSSEREARRFMSAFSRLTQTLFELTVPGSIHAPFSSLVITEGALVSCTLMPPLVSDAPMDVPRGSMTEYFAERIKASLLMSPTTALPLYHGADGRMYCIAVDMFCCHSFAALAKSMPTNAQEVRHELLRERLKPPTNAPKFLKQSLVPLVATTLLKEMEGYGANVKIHELVLSGLVPKAFHRLGLNLQYLYAVYSSPQLASDAPPVLHNTLQLLATEMVARTMKELMRAVLATVALPPNTPHDVQKVQRIMAANKLLDLFLRNRTTFFAEHVMVALRTKFEAPPEFTLTSVSFHLNAVVLFLCARMGLALDNPNDKNAVKQFAKFLPTRSIAHTLIKPAAVMKFTTALNVDDANTWLDNAWSFYKALPQDGFRAQAAATRAIFYANAVRSTKFTKFFQELTQVLSALYGTDSSSFCILSAVLGELSEEGGILRKHIASLPDTRSKSVGLCDRLFVAERCRRSGIALVSYQMHSDASKMFRRARDTFAQDAEHNGIALSSPYCDMLLSETASTISSSGCSPAALSMVLELQRLLDARGQDKPKSEAAAGLLLQLQGAAISKNDAGALQAVAADVSGRSLETHVKQFGAGDHRAGIALYSHLYVMLFSRKDTLPASTLQVLEKFRSLLLEMHAARPEIRQQLVPSEWCAAQVGSLIVAASDIGLWDQAFQTLNVARARSKALVGSESQGLEVAINRLATAHDGSKSLQRFFFYVIRRRTTAQTAIQEWLRRCGLCGWEELRWLQHTRLQEDDARWIVWKHELQGFESFDRFREYLHALHFLLSVAEVQEEEQRAMAVAVQHEEQQTLALAWEQSHRQTIVEAYTQAVALALDDLHDGYRHEIETQERRSFNAMAPRLETAMRGTIDLHEQMEVRELFLAAASRVLQRVLQLEMLSRVVPALSLYFFTEEQNVRDVVHTEEKTERRKIRLKEQVYRQGSMQREKERLGKRGMQTGFATVVSQASKASKNRVLRKAAVATTTATSASTRTAATQGSSKKGSVSTGASQQKQQQTHRPDTDDGRVPPTPPPDTPPQPPPPKDAKKEATQSPNPKDPDPPPQQATNQQRKQETKDEPLPAPVDSTSPPPDDPKPTADAAPPDAVSSAPTKDGGGRAGGRRKVNPDTNLMEVPEDTMRHDIFGGGESDSGYDSFEVLDEETKLMGIPTVVTAKDGSHTVVPNGGQAVQPRPKYVAPNKPTPAPAPADTAPSKKKKAVSVRPLSPQEVAKPRREAAASPEPKQPAQRTAGGGTTSTPVARSTVGGAQPRRKGEVTKPPHRVQPLAKSAGAAGSSDLASLANEIASLHHSVLPKPVKRSLAPISSEPSPRAGASTSASSSPAKSGVSPAKGGKRGGPDGPFAASTSKAWGVRSKHAALLMDNPPPPSVLKTNPDEVRKLYALIHPKRKGPVGVAAAVAVDPTERTAAGLRRSSVLAGSKPFH